VQLAVRGGTVVTCDGADRTAPGDVLVDGGRIRFLNPKHLEKTHEFYERYGAKTIILARFVPIVRTFAPFVAGIGMMNYPRFALYNVTGGIAWVLSFLLAGWWFGGRELVQKNFHLVIAVIIVISVIPGIIEYIQVRRGRKPPPL